MFRRYITVSIIPNTSRKVKKFQISVFNLFLLSIILVIFLASTILSLIIFYSEKNVFNAIEIREKYEKQKVFLEKYKKELQDLEENIDNIGYNYDSLKKAASLSIDQQAEIKESPALIKSLESGEKSILSLIPTEKSELGFSFIDENYDNFFDFFKSHLADSDKPTDLPAKGFVVSSLGSSSNLIQNSPKTGILLYVDAETPVKATLDGVVVYAGADDILSKVVIIYHPNYTFTKYGYLSKIDVQKLQKVAKGDIIGKAGDKETSSLFYQVSFLFIPQNIFN